MLGAAPILIAHLGGGSGLPVAEQCAWALGAFACLDAAGRAAWCTASLCACVCRLPGSLKKAPFCGRFLSPGNIAAEDFDFRQTLVANGVIRPLCLLVTGAAKALDRGSGELRWC